MEKRTYLAGRLAGLFLLGILFFQYPLLSIANDAARLAGIPVFFLYLFLFWGLFILLIALTMRIKESDQDVAADHEYHL